MKRIRLTMEPSELHIVAVALAKDGDDLQAGDGLMSFEDLGQVTELYKRAAYLTTMANRAEAGE